MRVFGIVGLVVLTQGCAAFEQGPMSYDATLYTKVNGAAFYDDSETARVGMYETTCDIQTRFAMPTNDYDVAGTEDRVVDQFGGTALITSEVGAWLDDTWNSDELNVDPVVDGRVLADDFVLATDAGAGCAIRWGAMGDSVAVGGACLGFDVERGTGEAFVGNDDGVKAMRRDGVRQLSDRATDKISFDVASSGVMIGQSGDSVVQALELDGSVRWETDLGAGLIDLEALGDRGVLTAIVPEPDGRGLMLFIDAWSGLVLDRHPLPQPPASVVASPRGDRVALDRVGALTIFRVDGLDY